MLLVTITIIGIANVHLSTPGHYFPQLVTEFVPKTSPQGSVDWWIPAVSGVGGLLVLVVLVVILFKVGLANVDVTDTQLLRSYIYYIGLC